MNLLIKLLRSLRASRPRGQTMSLCNIGEGFQPRCKTYLADGALTARNLLVKLGSDFVHVTPAGVSDIALGFATDETSAAEEGVAVNLLGVQERGALGVASGAIAAGDFLVAGATGTVRTLPVTTGTYYIVGRAIKAAADTAPVELVPCFPIQRVVA